MNEQATEMPQAQIAPRQSMCRALCVAIPAGVLLFAAATKWQQLPVIDRMGADLMHHPYPSAGQILAEAGLAIWLLSGIGRLWSRRAATLAFALFACVAAYRAVGGEASCGCFGELKVNPWVTFALDVGVVGMLCAGSQSRNSDSRRGHTETERWRPRLAGVLFASAVLATGWRVWDRPTLADDGLTVAGVLVVLEPDRWVGKRLPILEYMDAMDARTSEDLMQGNWRVVIYSSDCDHCRNIVPNLLRKLANADEVAVQWCFVQMPGSGDLGLVPGDSGVMRAGLTNTREWFASTPAVVEMANGVVTGGADGRLAEQRISQWVGPNTQEAP